jgi:hypothetical protein
VWGLGGGTNLSPTPAAELTRVILHRAYLTEASHVLEELLIQVKPSSQIGEVRGNEYAGHQETEA